MAFSDNFEVLKEAAAGVAQAAAEKTKLLGLIAKNNLTILAEEDKIKKAYTEIGKVYYKDYVMEEEPDEAEYLPWCDKITECRKKIEDLREEIAAAKEKLSGTEDELVIVPVEVAYPEETPMAEPDVVEEAAVETVEVEVVEDAPACEEIPVDTEEV